MVNLIELTTAVAETWRKIPPLVEHLGKPEAIVAYIDRNPDPNNLAKRVYEMQPGTILVAWQQTSFTASSMEAWTHSLQGFIKAKKGDSALTVLDLLVNGIPEPGDGLIWRFCHVLDATLPPQITEIVRIPDEEGIDYFILTMEIQETGDQQ